MQLAESGSKASLGYSVQPADAHQVPADDRERLWRRFIEEIIQERDNPQAADMRRAKLSTRGQPLSARERESRVSDRTRDRHGKDDDGVDRAYQREYLDVDRKRLRKM